MPTTKFPNGVQTYLVPKNVTVKSADFTAVANTNYLITASCVATLPAIAGGVSFSFINGGKKDGDVQITISPNASDGISIAGVYDDNKDAINTLATAKQGDYITLMSGNQLVFWYPSEIQGIWAKEA